MKGVILAAGIGSRLRPLTKDKPKCLVKVCSKAILDYQLDAYRAAAIKDIIIVVGYEAQKIIKHCQYINDLNIKIVLNKEYEETNNMYSLYLCKDLLAGKSFVLNNSDVIIDKNVVSKLIESKGSSLIAVDVGTFDKESMKVSIDTNNCLTAISKSIDKSNAYGRSIDFYKFSNESSAALFNNIDCFISVGQRKEWTEVSLNELMESKKVKFEAVDVSSNKWVEIDNYDDLAEADNTFTLKNKALDSYQYYFIDLDGTIYIGETPIKKSVESINILLKKEKCINFISNNSSKSKKQYTHKLSEMNIECNENNIILPTDSVIAYLKERSLSNIYVLGTQSLNDVMRDHDFNIDSINADIVIVGYDTELTYDKLKIACQLINSGIDYIATHKDIFCPTEYGPIPDVGAILKVLEMTTNVKPLRVFGKPDCHIINSFFNKNKINKRDVLLIGDRLGTDILMANNLGIDSLLVLSGETDRDMLEDSVIQPTFILNEFSLD